MIWTLFLSTKENSTSWIRRRSSFKSNKGEMVPFDANGGYHGFPVRIAHEVIQIFRRL